MNVDEKQFIEIYNNVEKYQTIAKVADKMGIHKRTVSKIAKRLREHDVKLENRSTQSKLDIVAKVLQRKPSYRTPDKRDETNSRILVISDMHIPYHHEDLIPFLKAIKKKYNPDRIICIGDELDNHSMSYHETDPDSYNAGHELTRARVTIKEIEKLFPQMDLVDSNHGSLYYRKAKTHGIPREAMVPYNDLLGVGDGWKWHFDLTLTMSDGNKAYFHHGKTGDALTLSQRQGMSAVQGHFHSRFKCDYWSNTNGLYWGLQVGCLIDDHSMAFSYNKNTTDRPIIGCGMIINGVPKLLPMMKKKGGKWDGELA
jgi:transcriptional regulator with XRE-family HTH domain